MLISDRVERSFQQVRLEKSEVRLWLALRPDFVVQCYEKMNYRTTKSIYEKKLLESTRAALTFGAWRNISRLRNGLVTWHLLPFWFLF